MKPKFYIVVVAFCVCFIVMVCAISNVYMPRAVNTQTEKSPAAQTKPTQSDSLSAKSPQCSSPVPVETPGSPVVTEPSVSTPVVTEPSVSSPNISQPPPSSTPVQTPVLPENRKVAYLTFDDGPSKLTPELLDALSSCEVQATFFVVGTNAGKYADTIERISQEGHVLGVHSWTHDYSYIYNSTDNFLEDFNKLKDFIEETTGVVPNICRFPGGTNNTVSFSYNKNHIMQSLVPLVEEMGFTYFDWNVSSGESGAHPPTKDEIVNSVVSQCKDRKLAVILFHDVAHQDYVDAIPEIISRLSEMGFSFDTLMPDNLTASQISAVQFKPS